MWLALALMNSAKPPSTVHPVTCCLEQSVSRPIRQNSHSPHVQCNHGAPTRSPMSKPVTPSPTATTAPVTSCPKTSGSFVIGLSKSHSPIAKCRSEWQTPHAATLINTSPGPGVGVGISSIRKGSANECKTAAFKLFPLLLELRLQAARLEFRLQAKGIKIMWTLPIANSTLRIDLQGGLSHLSLPASQWTMGNA